ncbi:hypothetical protein M427DRAFT_153806 [Gonapodya prolifera JEL478]|uniref:Uncharacterized protein n=1 Tax=Gonapodya prolifera (strain JEL478) TaxID=1344416 RepID=A0A139AMG3_GONPJ|nr:hypothetical protein M427DRAFT_153806 [Gonapodya prolifera JEL478]|eukprot:KXS17635.1 hypothetical protein M427DRAFT_153806 [Gonapodya prolifera JEL478]
MLTGRATGQRGTSPPPRRLPGPSPTPKTKPVLTSRVQLTHPSPLTLRARPSDSTSDLVEDELSLSVSTNTLRSGSGRTPLSRRSPSPAASKSTQPASSSVGFGGLESKSVFGESCLLQVHETLLSLRRENAELKSSLQSSQEACGKLKTDNINISRQLADTQDSLRVKTALLQTLEGRIKDLEREVTKYRTPKGSLALTEDPKKSFHDDEYDGVLSKSMTAVHSKSKSSSKPGRTQLSARAATLDRVSILSSSLRPSSPDNRVRKPMLYTPPIMHRGDTPTPSESGLTQLVDGMGDSELNLDSSFRIDDPITEQDWELSSNRSSKLFQAFVRAHSGGTTLLDETQSNPSTDVSDFEIPGTLHCTAPAASYFHERQYEPQRGDIGLSMANGRCALSSKVTSRPSASANTTTSDTAASLRLSLYSPSPTLHRTSLGESQVRS